ncbi:MAG: hypothetical protein NZ853_08440 [Leptospiraceae bacterium]|nr:hypothetical protein [Leptospiraceae bacterium]MDW7976796.1 hypothetical protein [Leptospiraceae bacterium]
MKFFVTGNVRSSKGPRNILLLAYFLFLLFLISNLFLAISQNSFRYEDFILTLEPSLIIRLEEVHISLFMFGFYLIFIFAMLYQSRWKMKIKNILFGISIVLFVFYLLSLLIYDEALWFFYFYYGVLFTFHLFFLVLQFLLILDLLYEK